MNTTDDEKSNNESESCRNRGPLTCEELLGRCYEICISGKLDSTWSEWFEGFEMHPCGENGTVLCGRVADQAALLGILNKLCRLNIPLVSVNEVKAKKCPSGPSQEGGE